MKDLTLVVLAAGMGSRFGGLKQMTPVDEHGNSILHYSIYDACQAGFTKVVFVIKKSIEEDFRQITKKLERHIETAYVFQEVDMLPAGFRAPEGRTKPWGTGHAVLCAKEQVQGDFVVINSDDFYGRGAYLAIADYLRRPHEDHAYAMVGYLLKNALTENGSVARGVCKVEDGLLSDVVERTHIEKRPDGAAFTEDGVHFTSLDDRTIVSMNFWGYGRSMMDELERLFPFYLGGILRENPMKGEFYLPFATNRLIQDGTASVRVLETQEQWYGVTYREDLPNVKEAIAALHRYPPVLFD